MHDKTETAILAIVVASLLFALAAASAALIQEEKEWEKFSADHKCKVVEKIEGTTSTGVGLMPDGKIAAITTTTPKKTGYACNDGVTYYR